MGWLSLSNIARDLVAGMADASVGDAVLGVLVLLLVLFLRRSSTAQHTAWTLVLAGMLVLPILRPLVPATHVHLPQVRALQLPKVGAVRLSASPFRVQPPASTTPVRPPVWPLYLAAAYLAGALLFGARLLGGVLLTRRALRNTRSIHSELWEYFDLIADAKVDLNLEESDCVRVPLTTGPKLLRVIFPGDWREWPAEKRKAILAL